MTEASRAKIIAATTKEHIDAARELFMEYKESVEASACFKGFEEEVAGLPGQYGDPDGSLLIALNDNAQAVGCIALCKVSDTVCEMKRLYVRAQGRGLGLGRRLVGAILFEARKHGYREVRLDSIPGKMDIAIGLYRRSGFTEIAPWYTTPAGTRVFLSRKL